MLELVAVRILPELKERGVRGLMEGRGVLAEGGGADEGGDGEEGG